MASKECLQKFRDDRIAREKARMEKLRELNMKKYGQGDTKNSHQSHSSAVPKNVHHLGNTLKPVKNSNLNKKTSMIPNGVLKRPDQTNGLPKKTNISQITNTKVNGDVKNPCKDIKQMKTFSISISNAQSIPRSTVNNTNKQRFTLQSKPKPNDRKSCIPLNRNVPKPTALKTNCIPTEKSRESVFDRLYKPKIVHTINETAKHPETKQVTKSIINKRHTTSEVGAKLPVRRSISAVHLRKVSKSELKNCIHKWASIGEKINKVSLQNINEDENIQEMVSSVKSERKMVKFQTPSMNPDEMKAKLQKWLDKHGKAIDSYHHLQCFGVQRSYDIPKIDFDEENKENIALENDSDNESYTEMNGLDKWRTPSCVDSVDFNESYETTMMSAHSLKVDHMLLGALNDLTDLLRNGYNWEECARWLRAIRETYQDAHDTAPYWECRAALEERRGDMPASMQCWEQALSKGTERCVAEANIDQLLAKFMQLRINPGSSKKVDPKLLDAKNVFKSTLLRFAVQEAKDNQLLSPKTLVTPVRRSARLNQRETPLKLFNTIQQAFETERAEFRPNRAIAPTP